MRFSSASFSTSCSLFKQVWLTVAKNVDFSYRTSEY